MNKILVALLTEEQKDLITGKTYAPDSYFNALKDNDGNWVISTQEVDGCTNEEFAWVKELPLIDYAPKPQPERL